MMNIDYYFGEGFELNLFEIVGIVLFLCAWPLKYGIDSNSDGTMIFFKTETDSFRFLECLILRF